MVNFSLYPEYHKSNFTDQICLYRQMHPLPHVHLIHCMYRTKNLEKSSVTLNLLLLVFSPWAGLGRDQSSVRRLVWLWYAASWASS